MIDKITIMKNNLSETEKMQIIKTNGLHSSIMHGREIWDNATMKNLTGGILIKISEDKIIIEGSIHKYFHYLEFGTLENYTPFSMADFSKTIATLFKNTGINTAGFLLKNYETGLNIFTENYTPNDFLKRIVSIGKDKGERKFYVNPKYQNETFHTTEMSRNNTIIFRAYDKNFERKDKGRKNQIPNCIRIETLRTQQKQLLFFDFCKPQNLLSLQNKFIEEWNNLNFDREILAPPGTHQAKKILAKQLLLLGKNSVLKNLEEKRNQITPKIFRTSKAFVNSWEKVMTDYEFIPSEIAPIWAHCYLSAIQKVTYLPDKF